MIYFICLILVNLTRLHSKIIPKTNRLMATKNSESIIYECKKCIHYIETKEKDVMFSKCRKFPILPIPEEQKISAPHDKYYFASYCRTTSIMCGEDGRFFNMKPLLNKVKE